MATKRTSKKAVEELKRGMTELEVQSGDVVGADDELLAEKNDTVCICCNLAHSVKFDIPEGNGRKHTVTINGNSVNLRGQDRGVLPVGAYGITANVPESDWEYIKSAHRDFPAIKKGLIFATKPSRARAEAKERKGLRHGLEPVDPQKARNSAPYGG